MKTKIIKYLNDHSFFTKYITQIEYKTLAEIRKLFPNYANQFTNKGEVWFFSGNNIEVLYITILGTEKADWQKIWEKIKKITPKLL